jgi:DNA polymerase-1
MHLVGRQDFEDILKERLLPAPRLSLDTETSGLRPYHDDRLFSLIIGVSPTEAYYYNFFIYADPEASCLPRKLLRSFQELFNDPHKLWYLQNAKFDMAMLAQEKLHLDGTIHCTQAQGRVEYNEHRSYSLEAQLKRIGLAKDGGPEAWIAENKDIATEVVQIPGKKTKVTNKFYYKVPFNIIVPYGLADGTGTFALGEHQEASILKQSEEVPPGKPTVWRVMENERRLTQTIFRMEKTGILTDKHYCLQAIAYETGKMVDASETFLAETGKDYKASPKLLAEVFADQKEKWQYTEKGNPSFTGDIIETFDSPIAKEVLALRAAKSKVDFYNGFLYQADANGRVHPKFNSDGTVHGRFSSSDPNFQNLTNEDVMVCRNCEYGYDEIVTECTNCAKGELYVPDFLVRRAIIPSPGNILVSIDYTAMEYYLMLDYACINAGRLTPLAARVKAGDDVHQATADLATEITGSEVKRQMAKHSNFLSLYGGGDARLAELLKIPLAEARDIRSAIKAAAPEVSVVADIFMQTAKTRGFTRNWLGRRCHFPDSRFTYRAPNYVIAGGSSDIVKVAMNCVDERIACNEAKLIMNVHDDLVFDMPPSEAHDLVPELKHIMENAYEAKYVPMKCAVYWSDKNLAEMKPWEVFNG